MIIGIFIAQNIFGIRDSIFFLIMGLEKMVSISHRLWEGGVLEGGVTQNALGVFSGVLKYSKVKQLSLNKFHNPS